VGAGPGVDFGLGLVGGGVPGRGEGAEDASHPNHPSHPGNLC
jgi:hypothetical protein